MLSKLRDRHIKKILWALVLIIVPSFILWGGSSFLRKKKTDTLGKIGKREITMSSFDYYLKMARLHSLLLPQNEEKNKFTNQEIVAKGWEYFLLLWKAKKEKITVSDQEVVETIKKMLFHNEKFNKDDYLRLIGRGLRIQPRVFEEYIRDFVKIDKLLKKYVEAETSDEEIKELYEKDTQKAKISYIFVPYEKFNNEISITPLEVSEFYDKNKSLFKKEGDAPIPPLEEIKTSVEEKLKQEKLKEKTEKFCEGILEKINQDWEEGLKKTADNLNLTFKETGYFKYYNFIEAFGSDELDQETRKIIFSLTKGQFISHPVLLAKGGYIIQLNDITSFNEEEFKEKKEIYQDYLYQSKSFIERIKFLSQLEKEAELKIYPQKEM